MRSFDEIFAIAAQRKGGKDALNGMLEPVVPCTELARIPDDRWLSNFSKCVFQAGFNWKVIDAKWDGFETAFDGFDVARCAMMNDEWFDNLVTDKTIVRNGTKILSVRDNAVFLSELAHEHGSVGRFFADWPDEDFIGLLAVMKARGSRLGGMSGQYALRFIGMDSFILSRDVVARLVAEGVVDKMPTSKKAMAAVQNAFNIWANQSGRGPKDISRVLAMSVG